MERLDPADLPAYSAGAVEALRITPNGQFAAFLEAVGVEHLRGTRLDGRLVAGAGFIPTTQRFGGVPVPSALVTAVWTAPAARGRGVASALLRGLLEELRAAGTPLSALYPANLPLYRRAGYATAAVNHQRTFSLSKLPARVPEGWRVDAVEGVTPQAPGVLAGLHEAALPALGPGAAARTPALWHALMRWHEGTSAAVVARSPGGELRGAMILDTTHRSPRVEVRELIGSEPDALRALLAHLAGYRGIFECARWPGGRFDPASELLRDKPDAVDSASVMVRIVDVAAALEARGYPRGIALRLELDVADDVLPQNAGRIVLELDGTGAGQVSPGGEGAIAIDVRALAPLYTGHAEPRRLALAGGLEAPADVVDGLTAAFAGPSPWLDDRF